VVALLFAANVFNLGADIGAMGAAAKLLLPGPLWLHITLIGGASLALQIFIPYSAYVRYLKWLTVALFAYVVTAILLGQPKWPAIHAVLSPSISFHVDYLTALIAVLGTTISPYLFFWQASEEVEEIAARAAEEPLKEAPGQAPEQFQRIRFDTYFGMALSNIVAFFIILTTASTLHAHGVRDIETADQAARALEPLAGHFAFLLFALGIIGTGLLAVPVLAGSAAYGLSEAFHWTASLEKRPRQALQFYAAIGIATLIGLALNFAHLDPIRALFLAAVINGVVAAPVMAIMMMLAANRDVMGRFVLPLYLQIAGWFATAVMLLASLGLVAIAISKRL
jgi:Mn2+/Fe2+ NRAMP family transporter